jgi:hypothetical protein
MCDWISSAQGERSCTSSRAWASPASRCRPTGTSSRAHAAARPRLAPSADHHDDLARAGASVFGLSSQNTAYQAEAVDRLQLPFALLSDTALALAQALNLPTFDVDDQHLYKRLTLIVRGGVIEHVFYPVFPTDQHAQQVLMWLREHRPTGPAPV